jgi:catechol 2,3-dioxygenase-like lactoylglutathione lyase family enzyme
VNKVTYVHTNLNAMDWQRLARFYESVFGCTPVPPERDLKEDWLAKGTGVPGAALRGIHLRLPGWGEDGPTLEIFTYTDMEPGAGAPAANRPGYGHLAFRVPDVAAAREAVLAAGGHDLGQIVSVEVPGKGALTFVYMTDPEGNIIELQS